jgi:hypothetical protein
LKKVKIKENNVKDMKDRLGDGNIADTCVGVNTDDTLEGGIYLFYFLYFILFFFGGGEVHLYGF